MPPPLVVCIIYNAIKTNPAVIQRSRRLRGNLAGLSADSGIIVYSLSVSTYKVVKTYIKIIGKLN